MALDQQDPSGHEQNGNGNGNGHENGNGKPKEIVVSEADAQKALNGSDVFNSIYDTLGISLEERERRTRFAKCICSPAEQWTDDDKKFMAEWVKNNCSAGDPTPSVSIESNGHRKKPVRPVDTVRVIPMEPGHIEGEDGVEGCYRASEISYGLLASLGEGFFEQKLRASLQKRMANGGMKGGMLHSFRQKPIDADNKQHESVCEELHRRIQETRLILAGKSPRKTADGKWKELYEGFVMVPKGKKKPVIAWATGIRSASGTDAYGDLGKSVDNDLSLRKIHDILISIETDGWLTEKNRDALTIGAYHFDTLNARERGYAGRLFYGVIAYALSHYYPLVITYRQKMLQLMNGPKSVVPQGNNDASEEFTRGRGIFEFGTRRSPLIAVRSQQAGEKTVDLLISSIESWMVGNTADILEYSERRYGPMPLMEGFEFGNYAPRRTSYDEKEKGRTSNNCRDTTRNITR